MVRILFSALVRPTLKYGSIGRWLHTATDAYLVERLQRGFLGFSVFLLDISPLSDEHSTIAEHLDYHTLVDRGVDLLAAYQVPKKPT